MKKVARQRLKTLGFKDIFTFTAKGVRVQILPANVAQGFSFSTFSEEDGFLEGLEKLQRGSLNG